MWNWDLLVVIRKCDRPVPSKSRSPLVPHPFSVLVCSAFMRPMFYSLFLSAHIGLVIFHPADWLLVTLLSWALLTASFPLWLYDIITCLYHHHQYSWPHGGMFQHPVQNRHKGPSLAHKSIIYTTAVMALCSRQRPETSECLLNWFKINSLLLCHDFLCEFFMYFSICMFREWN